MDRQIKKRIWTRKNAILVLSLMIVCSFTFYFFIFRDSSTKLNVDKDKIMVSETAFSSFEEFVQISGTIAPVKTFFIDLSDGGKVIKKYADEGAFLSAGDPIIQLDNPNLTLQLMSTQSSFMDVRRMTEVKETDAFRLNKYLQAYRQLLPHKFN